MKCEAIQNRLLDLPSLADLPHEYQTHVDGCEPCARFRERARTLIADLAVLPVPSSEPAKLAFLDSLAAAGPVIKIVPVSNATGSISVRDLMQRVPLRPLAGLAAAVVVATGIWFVLHEPRPPMAKAEPPRHELLKKIVNWNTEMAAVTAPQDRVTKLAGLAAELRSETRSLSKTAQKDEMLSLARMYDAVIAKGIVQQAEKMTLFNTPVAERQATIKLALAELAQTATEVTALVPTASQQVQPYLQRIAKSARDGEARLLQFANGGA